MTKYFTGMNGVVVNSHEVIANMSYSDKSREDDEYINGGAAPHVFADILLERIISYRPNKIKFSNTDDGRELSFIFNQKVKDNELILYNQTTGEISHIIDDKEG